MFFFICFSILLGVLSFVMYDPIKSSFFLILSLIQLAILMSFSGYLWYSYFVCLLFLSGVFVIIVYFASMSKFVYLESNLVFFVGLLSFLLFSGMNLVFETNINLSNVYFDIFLVVLGMIIMFLVGFLLFMSYFLNFSGGLRKF